MPSRRDIELLESLRRRKNGSVLQMIQTLEICSSAQRENRCHVSSRTSHISCDGTTPQLNKQHGGLQLRIKQLEQKGLCISTDPVDVSSHPAIVKLHSAPARMSTFRNQFFQTSPNSCIDAEGRSSSIRFHDDVIPKGKTPTTARIFEQRFDFCDCSDDESFVSATSTSPHHSLPEVDSFTANDKPFEIGIVTPPRTIPRHQRRIKSTTSNSISNNDLTWQIIAMASEIESAFETRHVKKLRCTDSDDRIGTIISSATKFSPMGRRSKNSTRIVTPNKMLDFKIENMKDVVHPDDSTDNETASLSSDSSCGSKFSVPSSDEKVVVEMPIIETTAESESIQDVLTTTTSSAARSRVGALSSIFIFLIMYVLFVSGINPLAVYATFIFLETSSNCCGAKKMEGNM